MTHRSFLRLMLLLLSGLAAAVPLTAPAQVSKRDYAREEYLILSGGPSLRTWEDYRLAADRHDRYWGNFIRSARIRIDQLRRIHGDAMQITWMVYRPGYETRQREDSVRRPEYSCTTAEIAQLASERKVKLVWFSTKDAVINYLNNRGGRKLSGFEFYGHSNKYCFLFDYSNDILGASTCYLHCLDLNRLHRGLFTRDATVQSYGCHTGEYMSGVWKKYTGHPMIGACGKTDFSAIKDNVTLPVVNGRWSQ
ncbi:MAG: hypothetical protein EOP86_01405 [Verrucomicrobiaceae bacterium]|nr:MAG: hypothetical protein EOP86_01405 [Verrucomicrobiaceae bacterium]